MDVIGSEGVFNLGGTDFDKKIYDLIIKKSGTENVDLNDFLDVKKPENWAKSLPSQILVILAFA